MKIVFRSETKSDLLWMSQYYESVFPEGKDRFKAQYKLFLKLLKENPWIGTVFEETEARLLTISKTPFTFVYRVRDHQIEILRILDQRSDNQFF